MRATGAPLGLGDPIFVRDTLAVPFAVIFIVVGATLLTGVQSATNQAQTARILGSAALLSLGMLNVWFALSNWIKRRRECKAYREGR